MGAQELLILSGTGGGGSSLPTGWSTSGGQMLAADGTNLAPSYSFASKPGTGIYYNVGTGIGFSATGTTSPMMTMFASAGHTGIRIASGLSLQFSSSGDATVADDTGISRSAAGVISVGNGAASDASGSIKAAVVLAGAGTQAAPGLSVLGVANCGLFLASNATWSYLGNQSYTWRQNSLTGNSAFIYAWANGSLPDTQVPDLGVSRLAAGVMALGNGTAGDISGSIVGKLGRGQNVPPLALTAQGAAIVTTAFLTGSASTSGLYRVSYYHVVTQAATTSGSSTLTLTWNDGSAAQSKAATTLSNTLGNFQSGDFYVRVPASQTISYAVSYASSGATVLQYALYLQIEQIQ